MNYFLSAILILAVTASNAQAPLIPGENSFEKRWIKNNTGKMTWYALRDTSRFEIGTITTQIITGKNKLTLVTQVSLKRASGPWIDSSTAELSSLKPVYHSSYNAQRDMVLNFGTVVTGYYNDKTKNTNTSINEVTRESYFDSNLYPYLVSLLPLKEGYQQDIAIYDYNPAAKSGVMKAFVKEVKSSTYQTTHSGTRDVWVVTVADEIGNGGDNFSVYYLDKADRKLWKQEVNAGTRKMLILAEE